MKHVPGKASKGFTLVELLVVIAIIGMLAALIMPVLSSARSRGRQSHCANNLHQISMAIMMYRMDHNDRDPDWLSVLFQDDMGYLSKGSEDVLICRSDPSDGADGSKPDVHYNIIGLQYEETNDTTGNDHETRYQEIKRCSYMYEFSAAGFNHEWGEGDTWQEAKLNQLYNSKDLTGSPYCPTAFPIVRCFNHYDEGRFTLPSQIPEVDVDYEAGDGRLSLNVAYAGNIFRAPLYWELSPWAR